MARNVVRVHNCADAEAGVIGALPRCGCRTRIPRAEAAERVRTGKAIWLGGRKREIVQGRKTALAAEPDARPRRLENPITAMDIEKAYGINGTGPSAFQRERIEAHREGPLGDRLVGGTVLEEKCCEI